MKVVRRLAVVCIVCFVAVYAFSNLFAYAEDTQEIANQVVYNPQPQVIDPDNLVIHKSITQTGVDNFDIQVTVESSDTFIAPEELEGISVALLFDNSGSMLNPYTNGMTKADALKEAANDFLDIFLGGTSNPKNEIAIVAYDSILDIYGSFGFNVGPQNTNLEEAKKAVDYAIFPNFNGATNMQIAMRTAREYLDTANNKKRCIILFSDGAPNISYNGVQGDLTNRIISMHGYGFDFYVTDFGNYERFSGYTVAGRTVSDQEENQLVASISEGLIAQDQSIDVFTIFAYAADVDVIEKQKAEFVMMNIATNPAHFLEANNVDALIEIFTQIAEELKVEPAVWQMEDPMAGGIQYTELIEVNGIAGIEFEGIGFDKANNMVLWDLLNTNIPPESIAKGNLTKRYSMAYHVEFDSKNVLSLDPGYYPNKPYPTNKTTVLRHFRPISIETGRRNSVVAQFAIPQITAYPETVIPPGEEPEPKPTPPETDNPNGADRVPGTVIGTQPGRYFTHMEAPSFQNIQNPNPQTGRAQLQALLLLTGFVWIGGALFLLLDRKN